MTYLVEGMWCVTPPIFLKLRESWSKDGHAVREMDIVYSVTVSLLVTVISAGGLEIWGGQKQFCPNEYGEIRTVAQISYCNFRKIARM